MLSRAEAACQEEEEEGGAGGARTVGGKAGQRVEARRNDGDEYSGEEASPGSGRAGIELAGEAEAGWSFRRDGFIPGLEPPPAGPLMASLAKQQQQQQQQQQGSGPPKLDGQAGRALQFLATGSLPPPSKVGSLIFGRPLDEGSTGGRGAKQAEALPPKLHPAIAQQMLLAQARNSGGSGTASARLRGGSASAPVVQGTLREREREAERKAEAARWRKEAREEKEEARGRAAAAEEAVAEEAAAAVVARQELRREAEAELYSRATMVAKHLNPNPYPCLILTQTLTQPGGQAPRRNAV